MFDLLLFENIRRSDEIESKLLSIFEGKNWEYIAKALYQILDSIEVPNDVSKESVEVFRNTVRRLHAKKNQYISSDVVEVIEDKTLVGDRVRVLSGKHQGKIGKVLGKDTAANTVEVALEGAGGEGRIIILDYVAFKKVDECVCHIYDMDDDELLEFYETVMLNPASYTSVGAQKQYPLDKAEVEEEIVKRRLQKEARLDEGLADHARRELKLAGMFDEDVDGSEAAGNWNNLVAEAVIELMEVFAGQGHSGFSASMTQDLFSRLSKFEALSELTDSFDEWNDISEMQSGELGWQNTRSPSCFSTDGGKTYWDINEDWFYHEDENGERWSGGLSEEEWSNRPIHQSKHIEKKE